jgi:hypothetical protein
VTLDGAKKQLAKMPTIWGQQEKLEYEFG